MPGTTNGTEMRLSVASVRSEKREMREHETKQEQTDRSRKIINPSSGFGESNGE